MIIALENTIKEPNARELARDAKATIERGAEGTQDRIEAEIR